MAATSRNLLLGFFLLALMFLLFLNSTTFEKNTERENMKELNSRLSLTLDRLGELQTQNKVFAQTITSLKEDLDSSHTFLKAGLDSNAEKVDRQMRLMKKIETENGDLEPKLKQLLEKMISSESLDAEESSVADDGPPSQRATRQARKQAKRQSAYVGSHPADLLVIAPKHERNLPIEQIMGNAIGSPPESVQTAPKPPKRTVSRPAPSSFTGSHPADLIVMSPEHERNMPIEQVMQGAIGSPPAASANAAASAAVPAEKPVKRKSKPAVNTAYTGSHPADLIVMPSKEEQQMPIEQVMGNAVGGGGGLRGSL